MQEFLFVEKYRPKTVDECILPDRIKSILSEYVKAGRIPNLLFEGTPGTGKTTAAKALCESTGTDYLFINSSNERGVDVFRNKISNFAAIKSLTGKPKCVILDEADNLTPDAQAAFRGIVETYSSNCTFIMTCNFAAKLIEAIDSRMASVSFRFKENEKGKLQAAMFVRLKQILDTEKIPYEDKVIAKLVDRYYPDFRKTLGELQKISKLGKIDIDSLSQIGFTKNIQELVKFLKNKEFGEMRKWVESNSDQDIASLYRKIYDGLYEHCQKSSIGQAVIIIAKYQYQHAFVADPSINLVACLTELMVDCQWN